VSMKEIVLRVEKLKEHILDPYGSYPACRAKIGIQVCDRCGNDIYKRPKDAACPAVPAGQRWRMGAR